MEYIGDGDTNCNWCTWKNSQRNDKWTKRFRNQRTSGDQHDYSITKIGLNREKNSRDMWNLAVTQTPMKKHLLTLVGNTLKGVK